MDAVEYERTDVIKEYAYLEMIFYTHHRCKDALQYGHADEDSEHSSG